MTGRAIIAPGMVDSHHRFEPPHAPQVPRLRVVRSHSLDPFVNLALEQQLFDELSPNQVVLYLWRNRSSVVIGRHQNPWIECDLDAMRRERVALVRRVSGGGAVYHDPGNGNFTFLAPASFYSERRQFALVIAALQKLHVEARLNERNDILIDNRKISGNAYRYRKGKSYHHGTLLLSADLDRLTRFLNPVSGAVVESKGIASVRSRVANLVEQRPGLTWDEVCDALIEAAQSAYGKSAPHAEYASDVADRAAELHRPTGARLRELKSWDWIYGHTPDFRRLHTVNAVPTVTPACAAPDGEIGPTVQLELKIRRGCISDVQLGDSRGRTGVALEQSDAAEALCGVRYRPEDLQQLSRRLRSARRPGAEICLALARQLDSTAGIPLLDAEAVSEPEYEQDPERQEEQS